MNTHNKSQKLEREKKGKQSAKAASWGVNGKENNLTHSMKGMKTLAVAAAATQEN